MIDSIRRFERFTPLILNIYKTYGIHDFPFDCFSLLCRCGFDLRQYKNLPEEKRLKLMKVSPDAAIVGHSVFYNESIQNSRRMRFSLMHEMAHSVTGSTDEDDADAFASFILAPPQLINAWHLDSADQIAEKFDVSISCANRAIYITKKIPCLHKQSEIDRDLLLWFGVTTPLSSRQSIPEDKSSKRLPPLLSKEEMKKWTPEQQKRIASIRRKRRKIAKQMDGIEGTSNEIVEFGLLENELEYIRLGGEPI